MVVQTSVATCCPAEVVRVQLLKHTDDTDSYFPKHQQGTPPYVIALCVQCAKLQFNNFCVSQPTAAA